MSDFGDFFHQRQHLKVSTPHATAAYLTTTPCALVTVHAALISVTTYQITENTYAAALGCVMYRGVDADIHHFTRDVNLKSGNVSHQIESELLFDVDAQACVRVGNPLVPVVGLVDNETNDNSTLFI